MRTSSVTTCHLFCFLVKDSLFTVHFMVVAGGILVLFRFKILIGIVFIIFNYFLRIILQLQGNFSKLFLVLPLVKFTIFLLAFRQRDSPVDMIIH
jgi:hypothetical protein